MPIIIRGSRREVILNPELLNQSSFAPFGTVIENPDPSLVPSASIDKGRLAANAVQANQGSALKYVDVTQMQDLYSSAASSQSGKAVMNMFVCAPRVLCSSRTPTVDKAANLKGLFPVRILERHPFTTQTFVPLGLSALDTTSPLFLVIVAPSLPPSIDDQDLPVAVAKSTSGNEYPGRGLPDFTRIRAFIARGSQAVTYGAGVWHAPMVVIGQKPVDFVVIQYANGVAIEDCQEVELEDTGKDEILVAIPASGGKYGHMQPKL